MKIPVVLGLAVLAGFAFAPSVAAQDQTAAQLDAMEQDVDPPPPIDTDAQAAVDAQRSDVDWKQLDTDGDGRISRGEGSVDPDFDRNFEGRDSNSDGYISGSELDGHDPTDMPEPEEDDGQR